MILITTGTSLPDDIMIKKIDEFVSAERIEKNIVAQIGIGKYIPVNFRHFTFISKLGEIIKMADVVVSSCGAGTIFEVLDLKKPLVVIQNPEITGKHEWELVSKLADKNMLFWCKNYNDLPDLIEKAKTYKFSSLNLRKFDYKEFNKLVGL